MTLLLGRDRTIMEISKESEISPTLIIHHLKKMIDTDIVTITKVSTNSRGHPMRSYRAKSVIIILSENAANRVNTSKSLQKTLGKITRFASIGLAGVFTWILVNSSHTIDSAFKYPRPVLPPYMTPIEPQSSGDPVFAIIITASVMVTGFVITRMIKQIRK